MEFVAFRSLSTLRLRPRLAKLSLVVCIALGTAKPSRSEDHVSFKWQDYQEDDGRVRVVSRYLGVEKQINSQFNLRFHGVLDAISGATPTGALLRDEGELVFEEIIEEREAGVVDLDWTHGLHKTSFQFAHSDEDDFLSKGYAFYNTSEYNQRNTAVSYGVSYVDDVIRPSFFEESEEKESVDAFLGVKQVLDPNTVFGAQFTYSRFDGYLNDPYKQVSRFEEILPGVFFFAVAPEHRPAERLRRIWSANLKRFFPTLKASIDLDYRYFNDSWGIESHTLDVSWYQKIGDNLILRPSYRNYRQSEAAFYFPDLNETTISLFDGPQAGGPYYSSDYRLAEMDTETIGLKIVFNVTEDWSLDASWERYETKGRDGLTAQAAFPDADVLTLGGLWRF